VGKIYFETVTELKYFGKTATNQNSMHKQVKRGLNLGTAIYHSVHNIFSTRWLSKTKPRLKYGKTISTISPVVLIWVLNLVSPTRGNIWTERE
jgi:hypothetical protein